MWQYVWAHAIYHLVRWYPPNNRIKITVVTVILTLCLLIPQFYILLLNESTRWCPQPLLSFLILSIIFTFFVIGFTFLFLTMVPVPRAVKFAFHIFGLITFCTGLTHCILVYKANVCEYTTSELYSLSLALAVLGAVSIGFVVVLLPFWVANQIKRNSVLDQQARRGICYEPTLCCSCLWHI